MGARPVLPLAIGGCIFRVGVRRMIEKTRVRLSALVAIVSGFVGFSIFFSDPSAFDGLRIRLWIAAVMSLGVGFVLGIAAPAKWWLLALVSGWGVITAGLMGILMNEDRAPLILSIPLVCTLAGAYSGAAVGRRRLRTEPRGS